MLPTIWCAISGHGFGHAAQLVPILNELGRQLPGLTAILRSSVPASFFHDRLTIPWSLQSVQQDVGCVQRGPLDIDLPATWEAHQEFHASWESRMAIETTALAAAAPTVILADTPYLAVSAGRHAGIPAIVVGNFTWSDVLRCFDATSSAHQDILRAIERSYADADMALRIAPGLALSGVRKLFDIGPIADPAQSEREQLRSSLGITESERLILVGFGGIPLETLPWTQMEGLTGYHFLVNSVPPRPSFRIHSLSSLPFSFRTALASVDVVMTKPGYGTIVEAVALGLPVVYVRRYNFADEAPLVEFLHAHGQGHELSRGDFVSGNWRPALQAMTGIKTARGQALMTGVVDATKALLKYFQ